MTAPGPGEFVLRSNVLPALPTGTYTLAAEQKFPGVGGAQVDPLDARIKVVAPRFALPADQVLSTFPPNKSAGQFSTRLPQIVLRRRTLPWERRLVTFDPEIPWLALVVLAEGEGVFASQLPVDKCVTSGTVMDGPPDVPVGDALTVTGKIVHEVFPTFAELHLLAHVRQVDLADTELAMGDDDGHLAVVIGNRLPQPDTNYDAYLISLEQQWNLITGVTIDPAASFTFPVLAHWSFTCTGAGDFQSLMQGLDVGLLGTAPKAPAGAPPEVLGTGHVALDHTSRGGEPGRAWYRGPLIPHTGTRDAPGPDGSLPLLHAADQARRVGPDGRENLSLATAFEIGRLLALAEPSVVAALLLWRAQGFAQALTATLLETEPVLGPLGGSDAGRGFAARAGLHLLATLGEGDGRRLGPRPADAARDGMREGLAAPDHTADDLNLDALAARAEQELAVLRAALAGPADTEEDA
jgi:hypothetical protein